MRVSQMREVDRLENNLAFLATVGSTSPYVGLFGTVWGIMGAFIFAAQMINFPVAGGTSGHFIGAALAFIVLGPWLGLLTMTAVIALQALLFQDGGLLVMGWNIMNMGVLTAFTGAAVYRLVRDWLGDGRATLILGGAAGAWLSVMVILGGMVSTV